MLFYSIRPRGSTQQSNRTEFISKSEPRSDLETTLMSSAKMHKSAVIYFELNLAQMQSRKCTSRHLTFWCFPLEDHIMNEVYV